MWCPYYNSTDDLFGGLGCYTWGMARAHDGLMMLLMVGRYRKLSCVLWWMVIFCDGCYIFYDGFYIFYDGWMYHVCYGFIYFITLVSWIWWGWCIFIFNMYILLSLSYPVTCTVDDWAFRISFSKRHLEQMYIMDFGPLIILHVDVVVVRLNFN